MLTNDRQEFWWLLALEATLFLSVPCWIVAGEGRPATYPIRFALILLGVASFATVVFHLGPAFFSKRFGPLESRFSWALTLFLVAGYIYYLIQLVRPIARSVRLGGEPILSIVLLSFLAIAAFERHWARSLVVFGLLLSATTLAATLLTPWRGLWTQNHSWSPEPSQSDGALIEGLLLVTAPALPIGYRVGLMNISKRRVLWSGVIGMFLPLCLAVSIMALTAQAAENLYWRPSLGRDFYWALVAARRLMGHGPNTFTITEWACSSTLLCPALQSIISVRILTGERFRKRKSGLTASVGVAGWLAVAVPFDGLVQPHTWPFSLWMIALAVTGAAMGLICLVRGRNNKSVDTDLHRS